MRRLLMAFALTAFAVGADAAADPKAPSKVELAKFADALLADTYPADGPGAAVLVARGDDVLYRSARGMANIDLGVPLSPDQVFRIGSVTKQFAATGLLKLVEAGKVGLDDPLSKFLPDYPNGAHISVRQLLNHTSGVKSYTEIPGVMAGPIRQDLSTAELVATFKDQPPSFAPGAGWSYNNSGYVLVGAVIEAASGKPWYAWLQESVLAPNGLTHTRWGDDDALIPGMTRGYSVKDGQVANASFLSMTQPHAAGALVSSVDDLYRWNRALHGGKLLKADSYMQMTTPADKAIEAKYGFGIVRDTLRGHLRLQHNGGIFGYTSHLSYLPDAELSVVVLQNADGTVNSKGDPGKLGALLGAFALGDPYPQAKAIDVSPETLTSAQGVYRIDANNTRTLRVVDGRLTAQRSGGDLSNLLPIDVDTYLYEGTLTWFKLERDAAGKISGMRLYQDGEGEGSVSVRTDDPLPAERASIEVPRAQLERLLGVYESGPMRMRVFLDGDQLKTQMDGQSALDLYAETPNRYFLKVVDATLDFAPESGAVSGITLHQGEAVVEFKRKD